MANAKKPAPKDLLDADGLNDVMVNASEHINKLLAKALNGFGELMDMTPDELTDGHTRLSNIYAKYIGCASTIARSIPSMFQKDAPTVPLTDVMRNRMNGDFPPTSLRENSASQYARVPRPADH